MSKIDKIKADISLHEKLFFGFMAALFAQVAWIVSNYETIKWWLLLAAFITADRHGNFLLYSISNNQAINSGTRAC